MRDCWLLLLLLLLLWLLWWYIPEEAGGCLRLNGLSSWEKGREAEGEEKEGIEGVSAMDLSGCVEE